MKKLFILLLSVVALVAFTSSAFALHGVKDMFEYTPSVVKSKKAMVELGGYIRVRGELAKNTTDFDKTDTNGAGGGDKAAWDQKVMLDVKATVSPNTMGFLQLQNNNETSDSQTWGCTTTGSHGIYKQGDCKFDTTTIRQAYISTQGTELMGILAGFKVGHMLFALGDGVFFNHTQYGEDGLIVWVQPNDNTEISLVTLKATEGGSTDGTGDDIDFYALTVATAAGGFNISGDLAYVDDHATGRSTVAGSESSGTTLWNLGLRGSGSVGGGVNLSANIELQAGEIEKGGATAGKDQDFSGWAAVVKLDAKAGDVGLRAQVGYGSGDDIDSADDYEGFVTSVASGQRYTYLYDQKAVTAAQSLSAGLVAGAASTTGNTNTGVANTLYVSVGASANVNPDVKVSGDVWWLRAAEKVTNVTTNDNDSKDIGIEVDGKVTYQIDTNLVWYVEAGYLFAGDFYSNITTRADGNPDDAYSVRHGVVLTF